MDQIQAQFKVARVAAGITQREAAERMTQRGHPMHQTVISKIESGARRLSLDEALDLCDIYGSTLESIGAAIAAGRE